MESGPAFLLNAEAFLVGTASMTAAEVGIYIRLLCHAWDSGPLPDNQHALFRLCCAVDDDEKQIVRKVVSNKFQKLEGRLINARLEKLRQDQKGLREIPPPAKQPTRSSSATGDEMVPMMQIVGYWNELWQQKLTLTNKRKTAIRARWRASDGVFKKHWAEAMRKTMELPFCRGENERNWIANLDWFLKPDTVAKLVEGFYENKRVDSGGNAGGGWKEQFREAVERASDEQD